MKNPTFNTRPHFLLFATLLLAAAAMFQPLTAPANVTIIYGVRKAPAQQYRTSLPIGARPILIGNQRLYLSEGIYYKAAMLQGRVVYVPVDKTWQR